METNRQEIHSAMKSSRANRYRAYKTLKDVCKTCRCFYFYLWNKFTILAFDEQSKFDDTYI